MRTRPPLLATLSLLMVMTLGCRQVTTGQSSAHPAPPETDLGLGFDSLSGLTRGKCIARTLAPIPKGQNLTSRETVVFASSTSEIVDQLGLSGGVSLGLNVFGLDLGFETIDRKVATKASAFAVIRIEMDAPSKRLNDYRLTNDARDLLREGPMRFYERCGDGFVVATNQGGLFIGIIAVESTSVEDLQRTTGKAGIDLFGFGVSGGVSKETSDYLAKRQARYFVLQQGGSSTSWNAIDDVANLDSLVQRASSFKKGVSAGRTATTSVIVKPYQVVSNAPRRAEFPDLYEQRKALSELAQRHGEFKRAHQQVSEILGGNECPDPKKRRDLQRAQEAYDSSRKQIHERAERCLNQPERECSTRRLDTLDHNRHERILALCKTSPSEEPTTQASARRGGIIGVSEIRQTVKGVDAPCALWQLSQVSISVAPSKPGGAPWDADGSPPEVFASIRVDRKFASSVPQRSSYDISKPLDNLYARPEQSLDVSLLDRDAMFDDPIASLSVTVPALIPEGKLLLQSGRTQASFEVRCVE